MVKSEGSRPPNYVWPLGNTTVHHEVMKAHDAHLPDGTQCFLFEPGYTGLPYDAITLGQPGGFIDFHFAGEVPFQVTFYYGSSLLCLFFFAFHLWVVVVVNLS